MFNYNKLNSLFNEFLKDSFSESQLESFFSVVRHNLDHFAKDLKNFYENTAKNFVGIKDISTHNYDKSVPDISIIISSYDSGYKLNFFLSNLLKNIDFYEHRFEVILIDSASFTRDFELINSWLYTHKINGTVIKTHTRITIQDAWNLALEHCSGRYLTFLGNDESVTFQALTKMFKYLEMNPNVDWVMGQTESYSVSSKNIIDEKVADFKRYTANNLLAFLDTSQLTWVGGMYRKKLHETFGSFNGRFKAAGDTFFKNKILPDVKYCVLSEVLGTYYLFPSARVTESPIAEIEDLVAVDSFRNYEFTISFLKTVNDEQLSKLLQISLKFRRSFFAHFSCDIQMAGYILKYMIDERNMPHLQQLNFVLNNFFEIHVKLLTLQSLNPINYLILKLKYKRALVRLNKVLIWNGFDTLLDKNEYYHEFAWGLWP